VRGKQQSNIGNKVRLQEITVARISRRSYSYMKLGLVKLKLVKGHDGARGSDPVKLAEVRRGNRSRMGD
jgi:hypothetical protein